MKTEEDWERQKESVKEADTKRQIESLQRDKNEQYEQIKTLEALVKLLIAFIFNRDWINYKQALGEDD